MLAMIMMTSMRPAFLLAGSAGFRACFELSLEGRLIFT